VGGIDPSAPPASIRILETKTVAYGSGLISFREKSVVTDPWIIYAAIACGISHEHLE
jgi:hypothetical protein